MIKHKWSKNVVGARVGKEIYIHPELVKHPKLYRKVLEHEISHTDGFEQHDIWHDIFNEELKEVKGEYWKFIITHPRTLLSFAPILKVGKTWTLDVMMTVFWTIIILGGLLLITYAK